MKRAAPYILFAAVTAAVFWKFLLFGHTMYAMSAVEAQLGLPTQEPRGWFKSDYRHTRVSDNVALLALHLRIYNEGLHQNRLALWNPNLFCGLPTTADPMIHPFYPPNLVLHRILGPDIAYEIGALLHLFFSGVAMHLLLRSTGRTLAGATAGALVWMLGGYQAMWFSTTILAGVSVFGPLALMALLKGVETKSLGPAVLGGGCMGLAILGSHPQHAILFFILLLCWAEVALRRGGAERRFGIRFQGLFILFSVGVGIVEILARLDSIENGYRDPEFDQLSLYAEPWRLVTYASSLILGKVYFPGPGWEAEFPVYIGLGAASLAVVAAVRHRQETAVRVAVGGVLAGIALAFVYPLAWAFMKIPILNLSPASRCIFVAGFCLAFLAAQGFDDLASAPGKAWRGIAWVAVAFLIAAGIGIDPVRISNGAAIETLIGFALAAGAAAAAVRYKAVAAPLAFAALLFELLPPFMQYNHHADSSLLATVPRDIPIAELNRNHRRWTGVLGTTAPSTKSDQWGNDLVLGNNLLAFYGAPVIGGFEAIVPAHFVAYARAAGAAFSPAGRTLQFTRLDSPLLDGIGLKYVLLPPSLPVPGRFSRVAEYGSVCLFENKAGSRGRVSLAHQIRKVRDAAEAEQAVRNPKWDPNWEVIVETDRDLPETHDVAVTWESEETDRFKVEIELKAPGVLLITDTDYPGWEAAVDGVPTPIFRANLAFQAIEVPAGSHAITFAFRPSFARQGLWATWLFMALVPLAARRWRPA